MQVPWPPKKSLGNWEFQTPEELLLLGCCSKYGLHGHKRPCGPWSLAEFGRHGSQHQWALELNTQERRQVQLLLLDTAAGQNVIRFAILDTHRNCRPSDEKIEVFRICLEVLLTMLDRLTQGVFRQCEGHRSHDMNMATGIGDNFIASFQPYCDITLRIIGPSYGGV